MQLPLWKDLILRESKVLDVVEQNYRDLVSPHIVRNPVMWIRIRIHLGPNPDPEVKIKGKAEFNQQK